MRYLLSHKEANSKIARQQYIYDVCKLFTIEKFNTKEFITLDSIPKNYIDVLFIIGHDKEIEYYLKDNIKNIKERNIAIISCNSKRLKSLSFKDKNVFIPKDKNSIIDTYDGSKWGFEFNITDTELNLYNDKSNNLLNRIKNNMLQIV